MLQEGLKVNETRKVVNRVMTQYRSFVILAIILIVASVIAPNFLSFNNITNVIRQVSISAMLACGMTFVILTGGIDLSVGGILGMSGALSAGVLAATNSALLAVLVGQGFGLICGIVNGLFISYGDLPPFIVTLATMSLFNGGLLLYTSGAPITVGNDPYKFIGKGELFGIPFPIIILAVVYAIAFFILSYTPFGRSVYSIGGNEEATRLSGINIKLNKTYVYAISGLLSGLGGIVLTSRLGSAQPTAGQGYELDAIAAVILGGTSLSGGQGFVLPTVVGSMILGILTNVLTLLNVNPYVSNILKGIVILVAVIIDRKFKSLSATAE